MNIKEKKLIVGTTHLAYTHRFLTTPIKKRQVTKLITILKQKRAFPYILTGDFNARPTSYVIKKIASELILAGPPTSRKTWTTKPFAYKGFQENRLKWRLDYVFHTPSVKVIKTEIMKVKYSDHLPILVTIEV